MTTSRTVAGTFTSMLFLSALAGCGGGGEPAATPEAGKTPPPVASPATPAPEAVAVNVPDGPFPLLGDPRAKKGGKMVLDSNSYPTHMNFYGPERDYTLAQMYCELMLNTLVSVHPSSLEYVPELASSWEVSEDQKTITFHLDPDAKWSDGTPVTAKDVAATYDLIKHPKVTEIVYKAELDDKFPNAPEVVDERTIRFVGSKSTWRNLLLFDSLYIYPAHKLNPESYLEDWKWKPPVVSGQYDLGPSETGKFCSFTRRNDFWGEGKRAFIGTGNFDELYIKVITDDGIAFETFKKGETDYHLVTKAQRWAEECDFDKIQKGWIQKQRVTLRNPEVPSQWAFSLTHPIFSDVKVRKALFWILDREYLHDQLFYNEYVNKNSYFASSVYENPGNEKVTFNPEKGLALLREAGFTQKDTDGVLMKDGKRLEFDFIYIHPDSDRVYTPLQETYRKYGVKMNLKFIQPSAWIKVSQEKKFDIIYANWGGSPFPEVRDMWHSSRADANDTSNICKFKNPEVDALIDAYDAEPDLKKRIPILQKMDAILYDACPYMLDWYSETVRNLWWDKFGMPEWVGYSTLDPRYTIWKVWWYDDARAKRLEEAKAAGTEVPKAAENNTYWKEHGGAGA